MSKNIVLSEQELETLGFTLMENKRVLEMFQHMNDALSLIKTSDSEAFVMLMNNIRETQYVQLEMVIGTLDNIAFQLLNATDEEEIKRMKEGE